MPHRSIFWFVTPLSRTPSFVCSFWNCSKPGSCVKVQCFLDPSIHPDLRPTQTFSPYISITWHPPLRLHHLMISLFQTVVGKLFTLFLTAWQTFCYFEETWLTKLTESLSSKTYAAGFFLRKIFEKCRSWKSSSPYASQIPRQKDFIKDQF